MTVSPVPYDATCREHSSVIVTSIQTRTSSCVAKKVCASHVHDVETLVTSQRSLLNTPTSSEVTCLQSRRTRKSSGVVRNRDGDPPRVSSISDGVAISAKMAAVGQEACDVSGLNKLWAIPPCTGNASLDDCSKLSRELAMLDALTMGVGGDTDCERLREELWLCRQRTYSLAQQNAASLLPLIRSKSSLKTEEGKEVERVYRLYCGCLEYLVYLLHKLRPLLALFHLNNDTICLIQTGLSDPLSFVHKTSCIPKDGAPAQVSEEGTSNHSGQTPQLNDDHTKRLGRDIHTMQALLCVVNNASDVQPWDVAEDGEAKLNAGSIDTSKRAPLRTVTFQDGARRRSRLLCKMVALCSVCLVAAIIVIASVLSSS
ncbi:hypothetical protein ACOMHN_001147 [Nucella lapillus]